MEIFERGRQYDRAQKPCRGADTRTEGKWGRGIAMKQFRNYMLAVIALALFAGAVVPANAAGTGRHHHKKHHKK